jgi:hypothetical protein
MKFHEVLYEDYDEPEFVDTHAASCGHAERDSPA